MSEWIKRQIEKRGLFKAVVVLWAMWLVTVVVFWFMIQPEKLSGIAATIGLGVIGIVGTVVAVLRSQ